MALVVAEFFLPTGGVLMLAAAAAGGSAIFIAYSSSTTLAVVVASAQLISIPLLLSAMVRIWPRTAIGRQMLNLPADRAADRAADPPAEDPLTGRRGTAATNLMPAGAVLVGGSRLDALSVDGCIDRGEPIRVLSRVGGRIRVCRDGSGGQNPVDPSTPTKPAPSILDLDLE